MPQSSGSDFPVEGSGRRVYNGLYGFGFRLWGIQLMLYLGAIGGFRVQGLGLRAEGFLALGSRYSTIMEFGP